MATIILMFNIDEYDRRELDRMSDNELITVSENADEDNVMTFELSEFCTACNDDYLGVENWWIYNVKRQDNENLCI